MKTIFCVTLSGNKLVNFSTIQDLIKVAPDEIMLIDMNAIRKGRPNFSFYQKISRFFTLHVLSLIDRIDDLVDTLIVGSSSVVISPRVNEKKLRDMLEITANIIMPYTSLPSSRFYSDHGGEYFLTNVLIPFKFKLAYYYGPGDPGEKYVKLVEFPLGPFDLALGG